MNLLQLAWRNLMRHRLTTSITALAGALALVQVLLISSLDAQGYRTFTMGAPGYEAVVGARGSAFQLVLNTIFQLDTSPGNLSWKDFAEIKNTKGVLRAVPMASGDNYKGFRVVGTSEQFFTDPPEGGIRYQVAPGGRFFSQDRREAVIGQFVARTTGLQVGSTFHPSHGLEEAGSHEHDEEYVVVGILENTSSPTDRVLWIPLEGILRMTGHVLRGSGKQFQPKPGQEIPEEESELSAVLLDLVSPQVGFQLSEKVNQEGKTATIAFPIGRVVSEVYQKLGWAQKILNLVSYLTMVVAAVSIFASIYNTLNERRREFAVFRALGMPRLQLLAMILLESSGIGLASVLLALPIYVVSMSAVAWLVQRQVGITLEVGFVSAQILMAPVLTLLLSTLAGLVPAANAYRTDVASTLAS